MLRHLDLFSGIGGFALAARWTGAIETVAFCEVDAYCVGVLNKNFQGVQVHGDITQEREWPSADIITGGFPCQPFSIAGKAGGSNDSRYLWPAMLRVIQRVRPRWIVGENVTGIVRMALDTVSADLEAIGYTVRPLVIPAAAINAPHRRDRVWILAHTDGAGSGSASGDTVHQRRRASEGWGAGVPQTAGWSHGIAERDSEPAGSVLADTDLTREQERGRGNGTGRGQASEGQAGCDGGSREPQGDVQRDSQSRMGGEADGLSGWLDGSWETGIERVAPNGPHRKDRLHALGNAIVPQVAYQILKHIVAIESTRGD